MDRKELFIIVFALVWSCSSTKKQQITKDYFIKYDEAYKGVMLCHFDNDGNDGTYDIVNVEPLISIYYNSTTIYYMTSRGRMHKVDVSKKYFYDNEISGDNFKIIRNKVKELEINL